MNNHRRNRLCPNVAGFVALAVGMVLALLLSGGQRPPGALADGVYRVFLPVVLRNANGTVGPPQQPSPPTPTMTAPTATPTPISLGTGARLGVWLGGGNATTIGLLKGTGARWTRVILFWSQVETTRGSYNFGGYDSQLAALAGAGLTTIVEIRGNPSWAASTSCGPIDQPGGLEAFGEFLRTLVQRYSQPPYNVKHWEFYNEPDGVDVEDATKYGIGCFGNYPAAYVTMLQTASTAIKEVDSEAKIVLGGLAHENSPLFNIDFLDQVLAAGGAAYFDIANVHYFSSQAPTWASYGVDIAGKVGAVRQTMARHGVSKPVAVTEVSWTSTPKPNENENENEAELREQQARYVAKVLARSLAIELYAVTWFLLVDWADADYPYGLTDVNQQPKPAYQAFQVATAEFGEATSVRPLSPTEVGVASGIEGYVFTVGGEERWVLWASAEDGQVQIVLPVRATQARDKLGQAIPLASGSPTAIVLTGSPIFVRLAP